MSLFPSSGRNPFLYSGHFNNILVSDLFENFLEGRNPFLYSGHFNERVRRMNEDQILVAIPSFIQGISTYMVGTFNPHRRGASQSLPLFRAFQQDIYDI